MKATRILWVSRHKPLPSQREWLEKRFGRVEIYQDPNPFDSAEDILARFKRGHYDEMVVVAPLSVIARLTELGVKPLWAEMRVVSSPEEAEVEASGRLYRFERFRRIKAVRIEFEEV